MKRIGEIMCPNLHPIRRNSVSLKETEGIGSKVKIQCGICGKKFKGEVFNLRMGQ